jgi:hypothetical protein
MNGSRRWRCTLEYCRAYTRISRRGPTEQLKTLLRVHEDFEKKMTSYAADVKDAIRRLANIAAAHDSTLDDHENRIKDLES